MLRCIRESSVKQYSKGAAPQFKDDGYLKQGCMDLQVTGDENNIPEILYGPARGYRRHYRDDLTGQILRDDLVHKARAVELEFTKKGMCTKVPKQVA